jgi:hypothetical protein
VASVGPHALPYKLRFLPPHRRHSPRYYGVTVDTLYFQF